jgi:hypothetical protein
VRHTIVGQLDVETGIASADLPAPRRLFVLLPEPYDSKQHYPVIYAPDGENLFDAATAAGGEEWGLDELLAAHPPGIPAAIVVGIESAPDALREYALPGSREGAQGDAWVRLVVDVVRPWVNEHYATRSGARDTIFMGEGAGATAALYAAWTHPDVFGTAIAIELPDPRAEEWPAPKPGAKRLKLWIEQAAGEVAQRPSATQFLAKLETGARVQYVVAGPQSTRIARVAAGLRAAFEP